MDIEKFINEVTRIRVRNELVETKEAIKIYCENNFGVNSTFFGNESPVETVINEIISTSNIDDDTIRSIIKELSTEYNSILTSCDNHYLFSDEAMRIQSFFLEYIFYIKKEDFCAATKIIYHLEDIISTYTKSIDSGDYFNNMTKVLFGINRMENVNLSYGSKEYIFLIELLVRVLPNINTRFDNKSTYILKKNEDCYTYTGAYKQFCLLLKLIYDNHETYIKSRRYSTFLKDSVWLFSRIENKSVETNTKPIEIKSKKYENDEYEKQCQAIRTYSINAAKTNPIHNKDLVQDDKFLLTQEELVDILKDKQIIAF